MSEQIGVPEEMSERLERDADELEAFLRSPQSETVLQLLQDSIDYFLNKIGQGKTPAEASFNAGAVFALKNVVFLLYRRSAFGQRIREEAKKERERAYAFGRRRHGKPE